MPLPSCPLCACLCSVSRLWCACGLQTAGVSSEGLLGRWVISVGHRDLAVLVLQGWQVMQSIQCSRCAPQPPVCMGLRVVPGQRRRERRGKRLEVRRSSRQVKGGLRKPSVG